MLKLFYIVCLFLVVALRFPHVVCLFAFKQVWLEVETNRKPLKVISKAKYIKQSDSIKQIESRISG